MEIIKKLIKFNFTKNANKPEFIVIHDTGNYNIGANAEMHYQYFNSGDKQSSAHFFIDDKQILQLVEIKDKSWHCGDGNNAHGINNGNSISVEICINNEGNYLATINNTLELVSYLMKTYNISIDKVVRHFNASGKNCPQTMNNNGDWSKWNEFKARLQNKLIEEVIHMFNDDANIAGYAKEAVAKMKDLKIINGDSNGNFNPKNPITREDLACVLNNLLKLLGK